MKLFCLGDSLTFGYGVRYAARWVNLAGKELGLDVHNYALNGDTAVGMIPRFDTMHLDGDSVLFIMAGANDIFYSASCATARAGMGTLIHHALASPAKLIVGIPMQIGSGFVPEQWSRAVDFPGSRALMAEYRDWLKKFCDAFSVPYVDFGEDWPEEWYLDGLHPNEEGHRQMAKKVVQCLNSII